MISRSTGSGLSLPTAQNGTFVLLDTRTQGVVASTTSLMSWLGGCAASRAEQDDGASAFYCRLYEEMAIALKGGIRLSRALTPSEAQGNILLDTE